MEAFIQLDVFLKWNIKTIAVGKSTWTLHLFLPLIQIHQSLLCSFPTPSRSLLWIDLSCIRSFRMSDISTLASISYHVHISALPVIIVIGLVGNLLNIYIVTRPSLRRSCSTYFLAGAVNGLTLLLFGSVSRWVAHSFPRLDATTFSPFFCRFRNYLVNIIYNLAPYFIACVTVDRYCSSSGDANVRRWSTRPKLAYKVIVLITLITFLAHMHILVSFTIVEFTCQTTPGFYTQFFSFFATIYYFTAVLTIIIFGLGTIKNIRGQAKRIQPMTKATDRKRLRNDHQLLVMLFVHVGCYTCFAMPYHITLISAAIRPLLTQSQTFLFIQNMGIIALNFSQAVGNARICAEGFSVESEVEGTVGCYALLCEVELPPLFRAWCRWSNFS